MTAIVSDSALALQRLYDWEVSAPDRVVLTQPLGGGEVLHYTWRDVIDQSRRMAAHLQSLGLQPGDRVAILSKNTAHWLMSDFAIWLAGGVSVPLYPTLAAPAIRQILGHSESKLLFVGKLDGWEAVKGGIPSDVSCISHPLSADDAKRSYPQWDGIVAKTAPLTGRPVRPGSSLATIIYTSGTTGIPKGVMHSFAAFAWAVQTAMKRFSEPADGRRLSYLPLSHVAERLVVEHTLLAVGTHVFFTESFETFAADMLRARPTSFFSVPRLWLKFQQSILARMPAETLDRLLESPDKGVVGRQILAKLGLDACTFASCSAAPMPPELLRWYARLGLNITEGYGMTEIMATHTTAPGEEAFGTVGLPFPGVECRLDPIDSEIQIKCPATMLGYYKENELTTRTLSVDGWLHTGDKGALDATGNLKITGRVKDLFKTSKGKYVAPAPIEDKLVMHDAVEACCVTGAGLGQPIALLMLNELACQNVKASGNRVNLEVSLGKHMESINSTLEAHEKLHCLVALTEPWSVNNDMVTPTLKVKRSRVEDTYGKYYEAWTSMGRPIVWHEQ